MEVDSIDLRQGFKQAKNRRFRVGDELLVQEFRPALLQNVRIPRVDIP